ncbi:MAG: DUF4838 domain-containing protein [Candidatus Omnitrophica bacterium]|nr:DUF4838 domain-containing protein [Candidatus Omnitrophota bacterium]
MKYHEKEEMVLNVYAPKGSFLTVEEAASAEDKIDWTAKEGTDQVASTVSFAAVDIAGLLQKIPGVKIKIQPGDCPKEPEPAIILLVSSLFNKHKKTLKELFGEIEVPVDEQSFIIKSGVASEKNGLPLYLVLGADRAGAMYGAYELLNTFGFRWFGPDAWEDETPDRKTLRFPAVDLKQVPSFKTRGAFGGKTENRKDFLRWIARNKLNYVSTQKDEIPFCKKLCLKLTMGGGHDFTQKYIPPAKYYESHPEWYALIDGKRTWRSNEVARDEMGYNICLSNREAVAEGIKNFIDNLVRDEELRCADFINIWPLDVGPRYCQCDNCRKMGNPTDQLLHLCNEARKAIKKAVREEKLPRDISIGTLAYHETLPVPSRPLPKDFDHDGIIITFFVIERCYTHAISDTSCAEINTDINNFWKQWTANPECSFKGAMMVGEYYNVSGFASMSIPFIRIMAADIPYYYSCNARHMNYMHMPGEHWGTLTLTNMQFASLLWNHRLDCNKFFKDFLSDRYRNSAEKMENFYTILEKAMSNSKPLSHFAGLAYGGLRNELKKKGNKENPHPLFTTEHLTYGPIYKTRNEGPSLVETVEMLQAAEGILDQVLIDNTDPQIAKRLESDARRFYYTKNRIAFFYVLARLRIFENRGDSAGAKLEALKLRDLGESLRREELMLRGCGLYENGLKTTQTHQFDVYAVVMADYGLVTPDTPEGKLPEGFKHPGL